jgi:hypothetical protein
VLGAALMFAPISAIGSVAAASAASAATSARILTCAEKPTTKPSTYILSCADAGAEWTAMTWSVWNGSSAIGHGILRQNNCVPNCAAGRSIRYRATVSLSKVITTKYGDLFSKAVFHYSVSGKAKTEVFDLAD